jgi:quercetin dioxygenase-like cupin family protein
MSHVFPQPIMALPEADIPLDGITAHLSQSDTHQVIFMEFAQDVDLPEHSHAAQVGFVVEGSIELTINGEKKIYTKGDRYYIPEGVAHSGRIHAGYADITFFNEPQRYSAKRR